MQTNVFQFIFLYIYKTKYDELTRMFLDSIYSWEIFTQVIYKIIIQLLNSETRR
jgi:hypothetical protein